MKPWLTYDEVRERFGVGTHKLREVIRAGEAAGISPAWVNVGTVARPIYSFEAARVDGWWREVHSWRATESSAQADGRSDGQSPATTDSASSGRASLRRQRRGTSSSRQSSEPRTLDGDTSPSLRAAQSLRLATP